MNSQKICNHEKTKQKFKKKKIYKINKNKKFSEDNQCQCQTISV